MNSRFPLWHGFHHPQGLFITLGKERNNYFDMAKATIYFYNKAH